MTGRRFWIGVVSKDHVDVAVANSFCMFAHGRASAAERLSAGDGFAYYSPKSEMGGGTQVRAFTALATVGEPKLLELSMAGDGTGIGRPAAYADARPADIHPLLDKLSFVHDKAHWGMYFRKSLFEIEQGDFRVIAAAMKVSDDI